MDKFYSNPLANFSRWIFFFELAKSILESRFLKAFNPLPRMPILGSSNSAANKIMMSKIWTNRVQLSDRVENIVGKGEIACYKQSSFPTMFSKAACS